MFVSGRVHDQVFPELVPAALGSQPVGVRHSSTIGRQGLHRLRQAMQQAVDTFAKAGWNIQWAKTSLEPEQDVKYLGFHIQLKTTEYTAAAEKEADIIEGVQQLIEEGRQGRPVKTRTLAKTVGRLVALRTSERPPIRKSCT